MRLYIVAIVGVALGWFGHAWHGEISAAFAWVLKTVAEQVKIIRTKEWRYREPMPPASLPLVVLQARGERWWCGGCGKEFTRHYHTLRGCQAAQKKAAKQNGVSVSPPPSPTPVAPPAANGFSCRKCGNAIPKGAEAWSGEYAFHAECAP